jgi:hypothetical protein
MSDESGIHLMMQRGVLRCGFTLRLYIGDVLPISPSIGDCYTRRRGKSQCSDPAASDGSDAAAGARLSDHTVDDTRAHSPYSARILAHLTSRCQPGEAPTTMDSEAQLPTELFSSSMSCGEMISPARLAKTAIS